MKSFLSRRQIILFVQYSEVPLSQALFNCCGGKCPLPQGCPITGSTALELGELARHSQFVVQEGLCVVSLLRGQRSSGQKY